MSPKIESFIQSMRYQWRLYGWLQRDRASSFPPSWFLSLTAASSLLLFSLWGYQNVVHRSSKETQRTEELRQRKALSDALQRLTLLNSARLKALSLTEGELRQKAPTSQHSEAQLWENLARTFHLQDLHVRVKDEENLPATHLLEASFRVEKQEDLASVFSSFFREASHPLTLKSIKIQKKSLKPIAQKKRCEPYSVSFQALLFQP